MDGYRIALDAALAQARRVGEVVLELAASSAGGGLRMAAVGLVDVFTADAGRQAALNAGARVELVVAGDLGDADRARIAAARPEVLLFCGGTDGGQREKVLDNAAAVAAVDALELVVVACNADIASTVAGVSGGRGGPSTSSTTSCRRSTGSTSSRHGRRSTTCSSITSSAASG